MSQAEIKNALTEAEAAASNNPENPGAEPAVQEVANKRSYDRTRQGRIESIDRKIAELQAKRQQIIDAPEPVAKAKPAPVEVNVGETVDVEVGRGETRRTVSGTVLAVYENKAGQRKVKVLAGEGADTQVVEAFAASVTKTDTPPFGDTGEAADDLSGLTVEV